MNEERFARVKAILLTVRELPAGERAARIARECGDDEGLLAEVESLLASEQTPAALVNTGALAQGLGAAWRAALEGSAGGEVPEHIGPYRILESLGEGGMGRVFRAEQTDPIHRVVALKLIRQGLDSSEFIRRFSAERQILAQLEHPGLARLIDGGITDSGAPWFTMEYVDGLPLDLWCDRRGLGIPERLRRFLAVCEAVQFAHRNLIVHRDLKPGNILVTGEGAVKLLDFGIAKFLGSETGDSAAAHTRPESRLLTPAYAAPEQIRNQPVTTATDVYSLGVILYELLCGLSPYTATGTSTHDLEAAILDTEIPRPSTRLREQRAADPAGWTRVAAARGGNPERLARSLAGDLDTICLTALRKEPERRYASVEQLSDDVRRHLEGQAVLARGDTFGYRAGKYVRRHRGAIAAAAVALLALVVVVTGYTLQLRQERDRARAARDASEAVTEFLSGVLRSPDPGERGRDVTVAAVLDSASRSIERDFASQPEIAARLELAVGRAYYGLGEFPAAQRHLERAEQISRERHGPQALETMVARMHLVTLYTDLGRFQQAESLTTINLAGRSRILGDEHPETLESVNALAQLSALRGHPQRAESLFVRNLAMRRRVLGDEHPQTLNTMGLLANLYADQGRFAEAEPHYLRLLELRRRTLGPAHPQTLSSMNNLALLYMQTARYALAEPLYRETLESRRRVLGEEHPETVGSMYNLAILFSEQNRFARAESLLLAVHTRWRASFGPEAPRTLIVQNNLARTYAKARRLPEAEALYRRTLEARRRVLGAEHPSALGTAVGLAGVLRDAGRHAEAEELLEGTLATQRRVLGEKHGNTLHTVYQLGLLQLARGAPERARPMLASAAEGVRETLGETHIDWARYSTALGDCLTRLHLHAEAEAVLMPAYASILRARAPEDPQAHETAAALAALHAARGDSAQTRAWRAKAGR